MSPHDKDMARFINRLLFAAAIAFAAIAVRACLS